MMKEENPPSTTNDPIVTPKMEADHSDFQLADDDDDPTVSLEHVPHSRRPKAPNPLPVDMTEEDREEKARLIAHVLELQNTLDDLSQRVDTVKEESVKLRSENQVLGQYIHNLMDASTVFHSTQPKQNAKTQNGVSLEGAASSSHGFFDGLFW